MHDGMQYDPIQCQGHELLKVGNPFSTAISAILMASVSEFASALFLHLLQKRIF